MNFLLKNNIIKRTFVLLLIATFGLSNTPTRVLHKIFADHSDVIHNENLNSKLKLTKAEFHCNCDNLVVLAPYINSATYFSPQFFNSFSSFKAPFNTSLPCFEKIYFELRGPPSIA